MPIEFACSCGKRLKVADEHAGKRAKCKYCGQVVAIPGAKARAFPQAPSPTTDLQKKVAPTAVAKAVSLRAEEPVLVPALEPTKYLDLDDFFTDNLPAGSTAAAMTASDTKHVWVATVR